MAGDSRDTPEIASSYLIAGGDGAKIDAALQRLRQRAESEGGELEAFAPAPGSTAGPDPDALLAATATLSLIATRRYLVAHGVERWTAKQAAPVAEALMTLPPAVTVVLVGREQPPKLRVPKRLAEAVAAAGGRVLAYEAPKPRELPRWLIAEAERRGFELELEAARLLAARIGDSTGRLATELDRLAVWAEPGGAVGSEDLEAMIADTSEEVAWTLSDAIVSRDPAAALDAAERLADQGEGVTPLIYQAAKRLREASAALEQLETGSTPKEVEASLPMHPYAAKMLLQRLRGRSREEMRAATCAIADLEWWTRGGSDYPERVALTLAVRRAAGA